MKITLNQKTGHKLLGFRFMWMKAVAAFDDNEHCAKCLVGSWSKQMSPNFPVGVTIELTDLKPGETYYLCGVCEDFTWSKNFHLAFKAGPWEVTMPLYTGASFHVEGIEVISFDDQAAVRDYSNLGHKFTTCRNFQFAAQHYPKKENRKMTFQEFEALYNKK